MNEQRLNSLLKTVSNYQGSFAVDELNQVKISQPTLLVVNLDDRKSRGSHWIGVAINMKTVYICDTLGGLLPNKKTPNKWIQFLRLLTEKRV